MNMDNSMDPSYVCEGVFSKLEEFLVSETDFRSRVGSMKAYAGVLRANIFRNDSTEPVGRSLYTAKNHLAFEGASLRNSAVMIAYMLSDTLYMPLVARRVHKFLSDKSREESATLSLVSDLTELCAKSAWDSAISSIQVGPTVLGRAGAISEDILVRAVLEMTVRAELSVQENFDSVLACVSKLESHAATLMVLLAFLKTSTIAEVVCEIIRRLPTTVPVDSDYRYLVDDLCELVSDTCMPELNEKYATKVIERFHRKAAKLVGVKSSMLPADSSIKVAIKQQRCVIDRSVYIPYLLCHNNVLILRPRRFGKSLWLSVLEAFFENPKSLAAFAINRLRFKVESQVHNPRASKYLPPRPVLLFDFSVDSPSSGISCATTLVTFLERRLDSMARENGIVFGATSTNWDDKLVELVRGSARISGQRIVVLIDEYDSFLLHTQDTLEVERMREIMAGFFRIFKSLCEHILLRVTTGITKWQMKTVFSGANDIQDLTFDPVISRLLGFTEVEVAEILSEHELSGMAKRVRRGCNGYSFDSAKAEHQVYNPYYIQEVVRRKAVGNYWLQSAPSIASQYWDRIQETKIPDTISLTDLELTDPQMKQFNAGFLVYLGYATIKGVDSRSNLLINVPNRGVRRCLRANALAKVADRCRSDALNALSGRVPDWMAFGKALSVSLTESSYQFLSRLLTRKRTTHRPADDLNRTSPATTHRQAVRGEEVSNNEAQLQWLIGSFLKAVGFEDVRYEPCNGVGRADVCFKAGSNFCVMELKCCRENESVQTLCIDGMVQIMRNSYLSLHPGCYKCTPHAVTCVLSFKGVLRSIMLYSGQEIRFSNLHDGTGELLQAHVFPPSNRFYMETLYGRLNECQADIVLEKKVRMLFKAYEFNALSLIGLEDSDISSLALSIQTEDGMSPSQRVADVDGIVSLSQENVKFVVETVRTLGPTAKSIFQFRNQPSDIKEFCEFFKEFCRGTTSDQDKRAGVEALEHSFQGFYCARDLLDPSVCPYPFKPGMFLALRNAMQIMQVVLRDPRSSGDRQQT